jgi:hypothetical protein
VAAVMKYADISRKAVVDGLTEGKQHLAKSFLQPCSRRGLMPDVAYKIETDDGTPTAPFLVVVSLCGFEIVMAPSRRPKFFEHPNTIVPPIESVEVISPSRSLAELLPRRNLRWSSATPRASRLQYFIECERKLKALPPAEPAVDNDGRPR